MIQTMRMTIVINDSQRTLAYPANTVVSVRLSPTATALANLMTNMSIKALAWYFSFRLVGVYSASLAD